MDINGNGTQDSGEPDLANVDVIITDSNSNTQTVTTDANGNWTASVPPGSTSANVDETDPDFPTGSTQTEGTDPTTVTAVAGSNVSAGNDGYYLPGGIIGQVLEDTDNDGFGDTPIAGVILSLVDASGNPILDDSNQPITTVTDENGNYSFGNLPPGNYGVVELQPAGYTSLSDADGGNPDAIQLITVTAGQTSSGNDFVEMSSCADTWADWTQLHPTETAAGNPDGDAYDNFAEFAFAMPYDSGTSGEWLDGTAWKIQPSTTIPGTLEAVFVRPKGAPENVTYTLQYAAALGDPTVWQEIVITSAMFTATDNGDCTETITIHDLETVTGLTGGTGVVRIEAVLDANSGEGGVPDGDIDHISYTEPEGWTETEFGICCQSYNVPYLLETGFTGTVDSVSGQSLVFSGETDLSVLLQPGASYYLEVTSGDNEGHRFDVVSATGDTITVASDGDLHAATAPFSTLTGAPPSTLAGDTVALRRHRTLNDIFPPASFGATGDQETADQVQVFANGLWTIYWLFDDAGSPRWVDAADAGMADMGGTIIPPGQGMLFNNQTAATSLLSYGEVRTNDFVRPLAIGHSLVGGGYPLDQSAAGINGRDMTLAAGFFGSRDFKTADSFFVWKGDAVAGSSGYDHYFLIDGAPLQPSLVRWAKVGDATATARDSEVLLLDNRAVIIRSKDGLDGYTMPAPWSP